MQRSLRMFTGGSSECTVREKNIGVYRDSSDERFYDYYAKASQSRETLERFVGIRECILRIVEDNALSAGVPLKVADIGCGAGTQCMIWAERGHDVHGLDVNEALVELARARATSAGYVIDFQVGSAVNLPWARESMDICLIAELLEHVADWEACLDECERILKPGGVLFVSTTNKLCPIQQEFNLPMYSWYPAAIKRYVERLAVTSRPGIANFAKYPAVNWFSFYSLRAECGRRGLQSMDRFEIMNLAERAPIAKIIVLLIKRIPWVRWLAHVATLGTIVVAIKEASAENNRDA